MDSFLWNNPVQQFVNRCKSFYKKAQHYRESIIRNGNVIEDVYDGLVYKEIAQPITRKKGGYSFLLNYDGATKWKSSLVSAIPIFMICNELSLSERFKVENVIFCGVWFGKDKPEAKILFSVLIQELLVAEKGIDSVNCYGLKEKVRIRCVNTCCDLPAKASFFYMQQHSGYCSCFYCKNSGSYIEGRMCFPLLRKSKNKVMDHSLRTEEDIAGVYAQLRNGKENTTLRKTSGVYGVSDFTQLPYEVHMFW